MVSDYYAFSVRIARLRRLVMIVFPINRVWLPLVAMMLLMQTGFAQDCPVPRRLADKTKWCWAAVDEMMYEYRRPAEDFNQCRSAQQAASAGLCGLPAGCCVTSDCDAPCSPQIKSFFPGPAPVSTPLTWAQVQTALNGSACNPFIFKYRFDSGANHFRVARGYLTGGGKYVRFNDPSPFYGDQTYIFYDDYRTHSTQAWTDIN
jgi:hypothetical protein